MKFLLSSLLLACHCALSSWSVSLVTRVVTQSADRSVMEGDTVNISCCLKKETLDVMKVRISWLKNHKTINSSVITLGNQSVNSESNNCFTLTLSNIMREDSGRYVCKLTVEIPVYKELYENGTVITVRDTENTNNSTKGASDSPDSGSLQTSTVAAVAVVVPLFILTLACFCILRRKQGSAEAARVIYEVPHVDSEVADSDKHSTSSSRGSSQWCQVPVYESFDYFEHMPTKQSG